MLKRSVAVLEIGSQKVTCAVCMRGVNGTFVIKSLVEKEYEGFENGHFFDNKSISSAVFSAIHETVKNVRSRITTLYVGVPGEFSTVHTRVDTVAFTRKKRISERDIEELYKRTELKPKSDYVITDVKAVEFILDDSRRVLHPEGQVASKMCGYLSFMLCTKEFVRLITEICKTAGVKDVKFVSESIAEALYLFSDDERESGRVIVDVGYLTTNVILTKGCGVLRQEAFSFGGGYITLALMDKLDLESLDTAESLKRKINLGYMIDAEGKYRIMIDDDVLSVSLQKANFTVRFKIDELAEKLNDIFDDWKKEMSDDMPVALTGGGLCYMRGAKEDLALKLNKPVYGIAPSVPSLAKPDSSALLSVLDYVLDSCDN